MNVLIRFLENSGAIGKGKAMRRATIAGALGVPIREVRELAEAARLHGEFVCYSTASNGGLYLPANDDEKMGQIARLRAECVRRLRQYSALRRGLRTQHNGRLFPRDVHEVFSARR